MNRECRKINFRSARRAVLSVFLFCVITSDGVSGETAVRIVEEGKACASIVVSSDAVLGIHKSAKMLQKYIEKSTGGVLMIGDVGKEVCIHVGKADSLKKDWKLPANLDAQEFIIAFPEKNHIVITGGSDTGIYYGILEFLERYVGVRWLFPEEIGEYVPKLANLEIPCTEVREKPAFVMRLLSSGEFRRSGSSHWTWAHRLRMKSGIAFHHRMYALYPPSRYLKDHPEFYAVHNGKRYSPKSDSSKDQCWNPCFTAPGLVEEGVRNICDYFSKHPEATSYSLAINDVNAFCECPRCREAYAKYGDARYYVSNTYYSWANNIARDVLCKFPDKKFGLLAYLDVLKPPKFKLDTSIVPFITYERMRWAEPNLKTECYALNEKWEQMAAELGWYDYIYGGETYLIPRAWYHLMAEYLRYGHDHKVRYYYAEAYPTERWCDGPKLYLTLKLLWNPKIDVNIVLDDWYRAAVGEKAAPYLKEYFEFWEEYWTERIPQKLKRFFSRGGIMLPSVCYNSEAYLDLLTAEDLGRVKTLMNKVVTYACTGKEKQRAEFFRNALDYSLKGISDYNKNRNSLQMLEKMPAIRFSGSESAVISDAESSGLNFGTNDFIIEAWLKPDSIGVNLLQKGSPGSSGKQGIQINTHGLTLVVNLKGAIMGQVKVSSSHYMFDQENKWYHLFLVADRDNELRFFKNGKLHGSGDISGIGNLQTEEPFYLGRRGKGYYKGVFGPVRIYSFKDGLISEEDLMAALQYNYNNPDKVDEELLPHTVARWEMNGDSPDMLLDSSGKGNHLKISGKVIRLRQKERKQENNKEEK